MKITSLFIMSILIISCSSTPFVPQVENISFPELNTRVTRNIGDTLLSQGTKSTHEAIEIIVDLDNGKIPKGIYIATGIRSNYVIFKPLSNTIDLNRGTAQNFLAYKDNALYFAGLGGYGNVWIYHKIDESSYRKTTADVESTNNFQRTLIYAGKSQNVIKVSYREYSGNFARPAFTIDVNYDLNESDEIAYQNARLKVIEATNVSITYIVLSNFN